MTQRTTVSAAPEDLDVLRREASRRNVSLNQILRELIHEAAVEHRASLPRPVFGVFEGTGRVAQESVEDEDAPAKGRLRS